jgi:hypothetical protein
LADEAKAVSAPNLADLAMNPHSGFSSNLDLEMARQMG